MRILVTGATGLLGSCLVPALLARNHDVVVTARGRGPNDARSRVLSVLTSLGVPEQRRSGVGLVDLDREPSLRHALGACGELDAVVHAAAAVKFGASTEELERTNVGATRQILQALDRRDAGTSFHLISTAFVCGRCVGPVLETARLERPVLNNPYEVSKLAAERLVEDHCDRHGRPWTILRPSIIAGRSSDGATANFNGILALLRTLGRLAMVPDVRRPTLQVPCEPAATKNIVPVDWVAEAIARLVESPRSGAVYHLTHPVPMTHEEIADCMHAAGLPRLSLRISRENDVARDGRRPTSPAQRLLDRSLESFAPYLNGEPQFDRRELERVLGPFAAPPLVDRQYVHRLLQFGASVAWSSRPLEFLPIGPQESRDLAPSERRTA